MSEPDWSYEGDPPTQADEDVEDRVVRIVAGLDQAATEFEVFAELSDVFHRLDCQGDTPLSAAQRDDLLAAFAGVRPTLRSKLPPHSQGRISDGFDAAAEHVAWLAGAVAFGDATRRADRRARMRLAQLESYTLHLSTELIFGTSASRPRNLKRIVANETEALKLAAEIASRPRPPARLQLVSS